MPPAAPDKPATRSGAAVPHVTESNFYDVYRVISRQEARPAGDSCSIAFWNLSSTDMALKVAGRTHTLPRDKNLMLTLDREFVWQVEGREAQVERVPAGESALEIVIRR